MKNHKTHFFIKRQIYETNTKTNVFHGDRLHNVESVRHNNIVFHSWSRDFLFFHANLLCDIIARVFVHKSHNSMFLYEWTKNIIYVSQLTVLKTLKILLLALIKSPGAVNSGVSMTVKHTVLRTSLKKDFLKNASPSSPLFFPSSSPHLLPPFYSDYLIPLDPFLLPFYHT